MKSVLVLACTLLLSGCVFNAQTASLKPMVSVGSSNVGSGTTVAVRVTDERPDQSLGKRGVGGAGADITLAEKVEVVVENSVRDALQKRGFTVVGAGESANAKLNVEVRFLQYAVSMGFWSGGVNVKATLKANASKGTQTYEHLYRIDREERVQFAPTAETNQKWINDALSKAIQQLVDDEQVTATLSSKSQ